MEKAFIAYLSGEEDCHKNSVRAKVELPASAYELRDALERAHVQQSAHIDVEYCGASGFQTLRQVMGGVNTLPDLYALNVLAEKLVSLDVGETRAFMGMVDMERQKADAVIPISRLYNLASGTDVCRVLDVANDAALGRYCVTNGLLTQYAHWSAAERETLDFEEIGRRVREDNGGVFLPMGLGYVERCGEVRDAFKDLSLTLKEPDYAVLMEVKVAGETGDITAMLKLPATMEEIGAAVYELEIRTWEETTLRCVDCRIPALTSAMSRRGNIMECNRFAQRIAEIPQGQLVKFKALLAARGFDSLEEALDLCGQLDSYILEADIHTPEDAAKRELNFLLCESDAKSLLPHVNLLTYGRQTMAEYHLTITEYGAFGREDGAPLRSPQKRDAPEFGRSGRESDGAECQKKRTASVKKERGATR